MTDERPQAQRDRAWPGIAIAQSTGVQVGSNNLLVQIFTDPHKRRWLIGVSAVLVLTLAGVLVLIYRTVPRPDLEVSAFSVQKPSKVNATQHEVYQLDGARHEDVHGHEPVDATAIDITLKNNGSAPAVLLGADARILYVQQLEDCNERGGELSVAAEYSILLPDTVPATPFTIPRDIRFEVRGGAADRFILSVGPKEQTGSSTTPWVIVAEVTLRRDDGSSMRAGTAAVVTFPGEGLENLSVAPLRNRDCIRRNEQRVNDAMAIQADARTDELVELRSRYAALNAPPSVPAKQACDIHDSEKVTKLCGVFKGDELDIQVDLASPPVAGQTTLALRVTGPAGRPAYDTKLTYDVDYRSQEAWRSEAVGDGSTDGGVSLVFAPEDIVTDGTSVRLSVSPTVDLVLGGQAEITAQWVGSDYQSATPRKISVPRGT